MDHTQNRKKSSGHPLASFVKWIHGSSVWDTIQSCVPPETILQALEESGFVQSQQYILFSGLLRDYSGASRNRIDDPLGHPSASAYLFSLWP
jgi:hypothetical protein